jgi:Sulfotransferase domain
MVGGPPRSGTTLLLSILGSHPHIYAIDYETTAFHPQLRPEKLFAALFFKNESGRLRTIPASKTRFAEKTPGNIRHADRINDFFLGRVKIVNIFRDVRDVVTSRHPLDPEQYWVPIERWVGDVKRGLEAQHYDNVYSIKYEDLVADTAETIRSVCDFIGEDFDPRMLEYQKHTTVQQHLAWKGGAQPIHASSVRKWEAPEHAARIEELMNNGEVVELSRRLGYM